MALYLLLVFASGILVGIVSFRLYATNTASANNSPRSMSDSGKRYLDGHAHESGCQRGADCRHHTHASMRQNTGSMHWRRRNSHCTTRFSRNTLTPLKALLTDQQKIAYDNWRAERERNKTSKKNR